MSRKEFETIREQGKAAQARLEDAKVLSRNGRWRGAMYLAGYHVECLLKVKLMEKFKKATVSQLGEKIGAEVYDHKIHFLMEKSGAMSRLKNDRKKWFSFNTCSKWKTAWRYDAGAGHNTEAADFFDAVADLSDFIQNSI